MVSTSDDDISELKSYESNGSEMDSKEERSDNDLEVMEILGQTESLQQPSQSEHPIEISANEVSKIEANESGTEVSAGNSIS